MTMNKQISRAGPGRPSNIDDPYKTICTAAAKLIAEKGYEGTSLQDVAAAVGMTKAGIYHYFPSKQVLYEAIVLNTLTEMFEFVQKRVAAKTSYEDRIIAFMVAHSEYFQSNENNYRASFFGRMTGGAEAYTPEALSSRKAYVALLEDILSTGLKEGVSKNVDGPTTARAILGMLNWMARWYRPDGRFSAPEIAESYANIFLGGLMR